MNKEQMLAYKLREYTEKGIYPMHMPGHKRNMPEEIKEVLGNLLDIDLTELKDTDDLHEAKGIIKEALDYAKSVYKTKKTYFLVNGSTCGVHTAIRTAVGEDKGIIIAQNAHFSAYNAIRLNSLKPVFVKVEKEENYGIFKGVKPCDIKKALEENENIKVVYMTSPTYDGIISDIEEIAKICHEKSAILIVDEAHGAHLTFLDEKKTALYMGADIVIQSLHKSLPAFTQTALLHINSDRVDLEKTEENLAIFESSSPSYIFMSSIDACIRYSKESAKKELKEYKKNLENFRRNTYKNFEIFRKELYEEDFKYLDESKLIIGIKNTALNGRQLADILRNVYGIELEMSEKKYILALTSYCDKKEGFERLDTALRDLDEKITKNASDFSIRQNSLDEDKKEYLKKHIKKVMDKDVFIYPPGIPMVKKGCVLEYAVYEELCEYIDMAYKVVFR